MLDCKPAVAYEVIGTRLPRSSLMLSVVIHALEFFAYHIIISFVDRVSRLPRGGCIARRRPWLWPQLASHGGTVGPTWRPAAEASMDSWEQPPAKRSLVRVFSMRGL